MKESQIDVPSFSENRSKCKHALKRLINIIKESTDKQEDKVFYYLCKLRLHYMEVVSNYPYSDSNQTVCGLEGLFDNNCLGELTDCLGHKSDGIKYVIEETYFTQNITKSFVILKKIKKNHHIHKMCEYTIQQSTFDVMDFVTRKGNNSEDNNQMQCERNHLEDANIEEPYLEYNRIYDRIDNIITGGHRFQTLTKEERKVLIEFIIAQTVSFRKPED